MKKIFIFMSAIMLMCTFNISAYAKETDTDNAFGYQVYRSTSLNGRYVKIATTSKLNRYIHTEI